MKRAAQCAVLHGLVVNRYLAGDSHAALSERNTLTYSPACGPRLSPNPSPSCVPGALPGAHDTERGDRAAQGGDRGAAGGQKRRLMGLPLAWVADMAEAGCSNP